jgi:hydrogenase maturation protein HypF
MAPAALETRRYRIRGVVQGVGFRPFVHRTATRHALSGWVRNDCDGVVLEVQGQPGALEEFVTEVRAHAPTLSRVESVTLVHRHHGGRAGQGFEIQASERRAGPARTAISPDTCVCDACLAELLDPADRRHRYPYINCTDCGPRYSIVRGVPYDRARTTMAVYPLCERCAREYHDVRDRRFHAQATACWECGPRMALVRAGEGLPRPAARRVGPPEPGAPDATAQAARLLRAGAVVAVKGLGGYHLMVDARDEQAVARLRRRKRREEKPLAVMSPTVAAVRAYAHVDEHEARLLSGPRRPIVLMRRRDGAAEPLAAGVAPGNRSYGAMLPYAPVHHLLFHDGCDTLVATSGNVSDEPIAFRDEDALERLAGIADAWLVGEREIHTRVDDSVVRSVRLQGAREAPVRRARGYTPESVPAPFELPPLLAVGPELKNTVCLARGRELCLSHHVGDLGNGATRRAFEHAVAHLSRLLEVTPQTIAHDAHPGYASTRYARAQGVPTVAVQHHHAHMAACMCEHGLLGPVVGVVCDGTGYGTDGHVWGGEFLVGDYAGFERAAHLRYFRLPGGDRAVREPYRVALALLWEAYGEELHDLDVPVVRTRDPEELRVLARMAQTGVRSPWCSSVGRLFDGVAALAGVRERCAYEAQAAVELEQLVPARAAAALRAGCYRAAGGAGASGAGTVRGAGRVRGAAPRDAGAGAEGPLPWECDTTAPWPWQIDTRPAVRELVRTVRRPGANAAQASVRLHRTVIDVVAGTCAAIRARTGIERVVLSGGVFQNEVLADGCHATLRDAGFAVYTHRRVPASDGGVALGQAAVAGWRAQ